MENFEDDEVLEAVNRYEEMVEKKTQYYFDVDEFEDIINFYIENNKYSRAIEVSDFAFKQHPTSITIQQIRAQVLIDKGKLVEALTILKRLSSLEPYNFEHYYLQGLVYCYLGDIKQAITKFELALKQLEDKVFLLYGISISFENVGQYEIALRYLNQAHAIDPKNLYVVYDIAYCYERIEENEKSIEYYNKYLEERPFFENAWFNVGVVYNKMNNIEKALEAYDFALAINPEYSSAMFNKANVYSVKGKYDEAIRIYEDFLEMEPSDQHAFCYIAECYERKQNFEEALKYYKEAISIDSHFAEAWYGIGIVKILSDNINDSISYLKKAIKLDSKNGGYWFTLGNVYTRIEKFKEAKQSFKKAIAINPFKHEYWLAYSDLYFTFDNAPKAIKILKDSSDYIVKDAKIHYRFAAYFHASGKDKFAYSHLKAALNLDYAAYSDFFEYYPEAKRDDKIIALVERYS